MIIFTKHANEKFEVLQKHKFVIVKEQVLSVVENPEKIDYTHLPLLIAQGQFDKSHVLRVVYKKEDRLIKIITFYPGRSKKYEK